jgi:hydroxyacylglutathione hydrolase
VTYARDHLIPLVDEGLGNSAYLADLGDGRAFPHTALAGGDEVDLGGLRLRALATPGHTGEHLSYLLLDGTRELGVFTGGSLIVGSAARTDLLGAGRAGELARAQYRSLRRLAELPGATAVWPTHGASLGSYPAYFARLGEVNRRGPALLDGDPVLAPLTPAAMSSLMNRGGWLIDVRPVADFAAGHIPGAVSNPLRDQFATWLGWLVPDGAPLGFVLADGQDPAEVSWQALKIGYENLAGHYGLAVLAGGAGDWADATGQPLQVGP